ncbi:molybdopterin converting factor subunit 1 [Marinobacter orientalis]|uniref:Molybdopterin synthase sulfur carrier subunit n=1 Tax=Marinobacter orientalis TaxID=1928859 RepID=A0A7Y0WRV4_9GAMM|nr:molybdopterin converting factor subunit 1 [Marinobacter orientalis]NMT63236.1 molybdopterin converting factor subunit 1 [Marinobacter orientalis]TGX51889.1 molybdopterin converting factor subunit 1 [Marinobacter orientalis]
MSTDNTITVKFFARLREELDTATLRVEAKPGLTAGQLLHDLAGRGGNWAQLDGAQPVMIAVNQVMTKPEKALQPGDEVAFFPPVTGG